MDWILFMLLFNKHGEWMILELQSCILWKLSCSAGTYGCQYDALGALIQWLNRWRRWVVTRQIGSKAMATMKLPKWFRPIDSDDEQETSTLRLRDDDLGTLAMFSSLRKKKDRVNPEKKYYFFLTLKKKLNFKKQKLKKRFKKSPKNRFKKLTCWAGTVWVDAVMVFQFVGKTFQNQSSNKNEANWCQ